MSYDAARPQRRTVREDDDSSLFRTDKVEEGVPSAYLATGTQGAAQPTATVKSDNLFKYRPDQARDDHGRFADEGGGSSGIVEAKTPKGGKKPKESLASLARQYKGIQIKRNAVDRRLSGLMRQAKGLKVRSPAYKRVMDRVKDLQRQRTDFTRQLRQLDQKAAGRRKTPPNNWLGTALTGGAFNPLLPGRRRSKTLRERARSTKSVEPVVEKHEPTLFDAVDVEKGRAEFNEDQARGDDGKWVDGWGTSERTMRRRRQQARERRGKPEKKPGGARKPKAPAAAPKPKTRAKPKPAPKPKAPAAKPRARPKAPAAKPTRPESARRRPTPDVVDVESTSVDTPDGNKPSTALVPRPAEEADLRPAEPRRDRMREIDLQRLDNMYDEYAAFPAQINQLELEFSDAKAERDRYEQEIAGHKEKPSSSWDRFMGRTEGYGFGGFRAEESAQERRERASLQSRYERAENAADSARRRLNSVRASYADLRARIEQEERRLGLKRAPMGKRKGSLYVCRPLLNADAVSAHYRKQGLATTLEPEDMHVTIAYSRDAVTWPQPRATKLVSKNISGRYVERLGDEGAVVMCFPSEALTKRWQQLRDYGASWDHEQYKPHVTLSYRVPEGMDLSSIKPYDGPLVFGPERFEPVKEHASAGYAEKMREVMTEAQGARSFSNALVQYEAPSPFFHCSVLKAEDKENLGLVFGWAIVSSENGEPYYDTQGDHIPEDSMLKAAAEFMLSRRTMKIMHAGKNVGKVVFAWPMTEEVGRAMGIEGARTGLMVAVRPDSPRVLERFRNGEYTGFSIGGNRLIDEEVD